MSSSYSKLPKDYLKLVKNDDELLKSADDIVYAIREARRDIAQKMDEIEQMDWSDDEKDIVQAKLIRQDQYLEVLLLKQKTELAEIFFTEGKTNCVFPDVLQWYNP